MGQSAGGQISAVLAQRARADASFAAHPLTGQLLQIPVLCFPVASPDGYYPAQYASSPSAHVCLTCLQVQGQAVVARTEQRRAKPEQGLYT
jgi:acetyl esterase/lipase